MGSRPTVVIVGGGIGGLFAANALLAQGLRVPVYEQAPALGEIGAGVYVTPNAVRHLERVGLGAAVAARGARVGPGSAYFRHDGTPIAPVQVTDAAGWNACFGMHRADFVELLAATCRQAWCAPGTARPASSRPAQQPACGSRTARSPKPTWWSAPTASTPSCGRTCSRLRSRCSTAPSRTAA
jgi:hypothetical protein